MRWLKLVCNVIIGFSLAVLALSIVYRDYAPQSTLMLKRKLFAQGVEQSWVSMGSISPQIIEAVIVAEDARFCHHSGVDWSALKSAMIEAAEEGEGPKGASTITMQLTRNLFLWQSRSYIRKILEIPLSVMLDAVMSKRRIMEIYLNIAEWGDGIFGVEAASRHYFKKSAGSLNAREASLLVSALPSPVKRNPAKPGAYTKQYAGKINRRLNADVAYTGCLRYR